MLKTIGFEASKHREIEIEGSRIGQGQFRAMLVRILHIMLGQKDLQIMHITLGCLRENQRVDSPGVGPKHSKTARLTDVCLKLPELGLQPHSLAAFRQSRPQRLNGSMTPFFGVSDRKPGFFNEVRLVFL
jgi:hypothetical protein